MRLQETQKRFLDFLYLPKVTESSLGDMDSLVINGKLSAQSGLKIYRKNFIFNFISVLKETYPFCFAFLGEKNFNYLAKEYVLQNPSINSDIIEYGGSFSDFLANRSEIQSYLFLVDVAHIEWAKERVYYKRPDRSITPEQIEALMGQEPDQIFLSLRQPIYLVHTEFQIHGVYDAFHTNGLLRTEIIHPKRERLVVWNDNGEANITQVSENTCELLQALKHRKSLGSILTEGFFDKNSYAFNEEIKILFLNGWIGSTNEPNTLDKTN